METEKLADVLTNYWTWFLIFVWPVLSSILNAILRWKTAEEWVAFCELNPRLGTLVRIIRAVGLDPVKVVQTLKQRSAEKAEEKQAASVREAVAAGEVVRVAPPPTALVSPEAAVLEKVLPDLPVVPATEEPAKEGNSPA